MSKAKFAIGAAIGAGLSYWAAKKVVSHKDLIISFVTDKLDQVPKVNKQKMKQAFNEETTKLQQTMNTKNSADIKTNFDDIKLDADQINLDK